MTETETHIRSTLDRVVNTFTARPGSARGTYNARVEAGEGLTATAREGDWTLDFDMPEALGGAGTAPTPGVYGRTTLLACLAIGLRMEALREGLPHARIAVAMECDCDNRGLFGIGEVPPGYEDFRLMVEVESDAPESELRAWLNRTLGHNPWLDVLPPPAACQHRASGRAAGGRLSQVSAQRMDAELLDFPDASFDAAICALGLMYVPDPVHALAEMARVTRPGERVAVTVWGERRKCGWADIFPIVDARIASEVCPMFFGIGGRGVLLNMASTAGISNAREVRDRATLAWPDAESLLAAVIDGGPIALAAKRFSPEVRAEVDAEFLAAIAEFSNTDGSYAIPGEFVTVAGTV